MVGSLIRHWKDEANALAVKARSTEKIMECEPPADQIEMCR